MGEGGGGVGKCEIRTKVFDKTKSSVALVDRVHSVLVTKNTSQMPRLQSNSYFIGYRLSHYLAKSEFQVCSIKDHKS